MDYLALLIKLKPFLTDDQYHAYHRVRMSSDGNPHARKSAELALYVAAIRLLGEDFFEDDSAILLELPPPHVANGLDRFGRVHYGDHATCAIFGLRRNQWIRQMTIMGTLRFKRCSSMCSSILLRHPSLFRVPKQYKEALLVYSGTMR